MKLTAKQVESLRPSVIKALRSFGYEGPINADSMLEYVESNELKDAIQINGEPLTKKALMQISGTVDIEPAEEVATEEMDEEEEVKEADEENEKGKSVRRQIVKTSTSTTNAAVFSPMSMARKRYENRVKRGQAGFCDTEAAELFSAWFRSQSVKHVHDNDRTKASKWYTESGQDRADIDVLKAYGYKDANTVDPTLGGSLLREAFDQNVVSIKNEYGIARKYADVITSPEKVYRYTLDGADNTAAWATEASTISTSEKKFEPQALVANKLAARDKASSEIYTAPGVSIAEKIATSMLRSIYQKEDLAWLVGDGSGTYGGFIGLVKRLTNMGVAANVEGLVEATDEVWSAHTHGDILKLMGTVTKGNSANRKFICSEPYYYQVLRRLASGQGGVTRAEMAGDYPYSFEGKEVIIDHSGAMPTTGSLGTVPLLYGDFSTSSRMLDVSGSQEFATSEHFHFDTDEIALRYRVECAFNVHGHGTTSEAGAYAALINPTS